MPFASSGSRVADETFAEGGGGHEPAGTGEGGALSYSDSKGRLAGMVQEYVSGRADWHLEGCLESDFDNVIEG